MLDAEKHLSSPYHFGSILEVFSLYLLAGYPRGYMGKLLNIGTLALWKWDVEHLSCDPSVGGDTDFRTSVSLVLQCRVYTLICTAAMSQLPPIINLEGLNDVQP